MSIFYRIGTREAAEKCAGQMIAHAMLSHAGECHGLATGNSVKGPYQHALQYISGRRHDQLSSLRTFNLDEWDWPGHLKLMGRTDPRTFRGFMDEHLLRGLAEMQFCIEKAAFPSDFLPEGERFKADLDLSAYDAAIADAGGIDTWTIGIGQGRADNLTGGHVAFVEPEHLGHLGDKWIEQHSYTALLAAKTREDNAGYAGCDGKITKVPSLAMTVGPATLFNHVRRQVILLAFGDCKAWPLFGALEQEPTWRCPASIVQLMSDQGVCVHVFMNEASSQHLREQSRRLAL